MGYLHSERAVHDGLLTSDAGPLRIIERQASRYRVAAEDHEATSQPFLMTFLALYLRLRSLDRDLHPTSHFILLYSRDCCRQDLVPRG